MFIRHGDRSSGHFIPGHLPADLNCNFSTWYTGSDDKIRHFASRMDSMMPPSGFEQKILYPKRERCASNTLTARGAQQHIQLGGHLQKAYMDQHSLIDKQNPYGQQLLIKATHYSRTFESAMALLYGFFPHLDVSKLNVDVAKNTVFCFPKLPYVTSCLCKRLKDTDDAINRKKDQTRIEASTKLQDTISNILGKPIPDNTAITAIGDALTPGFCHSKPLPCRTKHSNQSPNIQNESTCVSLDLVGKIWKEINAQLKTHDDNDYLLSAKLKLYPVLLEVATRIQSLQQLKFAPRFVLYSGHDVTITPLLLVMGLHNGKWPPYASRFVIETIESEQTNTFYLRFIYNGVDKTSDVIFCKSTQLKDGLCPLEAFLTFIFKDCLQNHGYDSYKAACWS